MKTLNLIRKNSLGKQWLMPILLGMLMFVLSEAYAGGAKPTPRNPVVVRPGTVFPTDYYIPPAQIIPKKPTTPAIENDVPTTSIGTVKIDKNP